MVGGVDGRRIAFALGVFGAASLALIAAARARREKGGGALTLELIPPPVYSYGGYSYGGDPAYSPGTVIRVTGVARAGEPPPDMELQIQVYDPATRTFKTFKSRSVRAVPLGQPQVLEHAFTGYGESGTYRGYMRLSNPIGVVEYVTDAVTVTIGTVPSGELSVGIPAAGVTAGGAPVSPPRLLV